MKPILFLSMVLVGAQASAQATLHVNADLTTGANDGSSWANAYRGPDSLKTALAAAAPGNRVFVARGHYRPSQTFDRDASFTLPGGVKVYGGFAGWESHESQRPHPDFGVSVLSGDLAANDDGPAPDRSDNSVHVVRYDLVNTPARLDGFRIEGGSALSLVGIGGGIGAGLWASGQLTVANCHFHDNDAIDGGAGAHGTGPVRFEDCRFTDNVAVAGRGGALELVQASFGSVTRCEFRHNVAGVEGGAIATADWSGFISDSAFLENQAPVGSAMIMQTMTVASPTLAGCTLAANLAGQSGAFALDHAGTAPSMSHMILWDNFAGPGSAPSTARPGIHAFTSIIQGGYPGTGISTADPLLVGSVASGPYSAALRPGSPAIDAATNSPPQSAADVRGKRRVEDVPGIPNTGPGGGFMDLGATESTTAISSVSLQCGVTLNSTGLPGRSAAFGSDLLADNDITLRAYDLPQNAFGFFIISRISSFVPGPGVPGGHLCLSGEIGRLIGPGQIQNTGTAGEFTVQLDLTRIPQPTGFVPAMLGDTWHFQCWHRDAIMGMPFSFFTETSTISPR